MTPRPTAALLGLLLFLTPARGWIPLVGDLWPDGRVAVSFGVTDAMPTPGADWAQAVREAAALWNAHLQRIQLELVPATEPAWYENGRSEVFFDRQMFDEPFPSGVLAVTGTTRDRGTRIETDIIVNARVFWSIYEGAPRSTPDFRRVMVHELGHLIGLGHPDENEQAVSAIMNSRIGVVLAPTADDEAGARALYDFGPPAAPVIRTQPSPVNVPAGATAELSVRAGGRGPLVYQWQRNGVPLPAATSDTLRFATTLADDGDYAVTVSNGGGSVPSRTARLTVRPAIAPVLVAHTTATSVAAGTDVTLNAPLSQGDAPLRYEWRKNGLPIAGAETTTLRLTDVQFSDAGDYTLTATNAAGANTTPIMRLAVTPGRPPRSYGELPSTVVAPGATITLSSNVVGSGVLSYQWQKDGIPIPGATSSSHTLTSFQASQAGRYSVVVTNAFGSVTTTGGVLTAFDAADFMIVREPAAVTEHEGAEVTFSVETSSPAASYQWFRNGAPLENMPAFRWSGTRSHTLTIRSITPDETAVYAVEVASGARRIRSQPARLTVLAPMPAEIVLHPATHTVTSGTMVTLTVGVRSTNLPVSYQWFRNDVAVPGQTASSYSFAADESRAGRYRARVATVNGTSDSDVAEVIIVSTPMLFTAHPASRLFVYGSEELRLTAVADEIQRRRAQREGWVQTYARNGVAVPSPFTGPGGLTPGTYTYTIGPIGATETSRPFTLGFVGLGLPVLKRHPRGASVLVGDSAVLDVIATPADVSYQWHHDGAAIPGAISSSYWIPFFAERNRGGYSVTVTNSTGTAVSEIAVLEIRGLESPLIHSHPASLTVTAGEQINLHVTTRRGEFRYQWLKNGTAIPGATNSNLLFVAGSGAAGQYFVTVTDGTSSAISRPAQVEVLAAQRAPEILFQPGDEFAVVGGDVVFSVGADGAPPPDRYQWRKDGVDIPGATDAKLRLHSVQPGAAGAYSVVVFNALGSAVSQPARLQLDESARLVNLATRAAVGRGSDILIAGFVIGGTETRRVLIRGIGDQLSEFGVEGVLRDPVVRVFDARERLLATNDDWWRMGATQAAELVAAAREAGAFAQRADARDAAVLLTLAPGAYTAQVSGLANTTGVALVEVYELGKPAKGRLINLSSRAVVGTGANILIPGLVLNGRGPRKLLCRAVGPTLAQFGIASALTDPVVTLFRGDEPIAANDHWGESGNAGEIASAAAAVGAFPLPGGSRDAALLAELPPGNYTIQVSGAGGTTGVALVEVYEVGP